MKQYVGARYIPVWKGDHDREQAYEPTDIVTSGTQDYIAIRPVPPGIYVNNTLYWHPYGGITKIFAIAPNEITIPFYTYYSQATVVMVNKPDVEISFETTGPIEIQVFGDNIIITPSEPGLATITATAADGQIATCAVTVIDEQFQELAYLDLQEVRTTYTPLTFNLPENLSIEVKIIPEITTGCSIWGGDSRENYPPRLLLDNQNRIKYQRAAVDYINLANYNSDGLFTISCNLQNTVANEYVYKVNDYVTRSQYYLPTNNVIWLGKDFIGKLFYFIVRDNDTDAIVEKLIPARNLEDNKIGLLSTVSRTFVEVPYSSAPTE